MKLILCPNCCESNLTQEGNLFRCAVCGALVTDEEKRSIEDRIESALSHGQESDLGKMRYLLKGELSAEFPDQLAILSDCENILRILPEDPIASTLKAFFRKAQHRKEYHFLLSHLPALSVYQKKLLYPYIIGLCDHVDAPSVKPFLIAQGDRERLPEVDEALKQRDLEADLFANVPRDVFVCHAHADYGRIKPLMDRLEEEEGFTLWYSERNLPKDTDNYKTNIENAIENCSIFLVFASSVSMASRDVQWELDVADKLGKRKRLEYRLEDRNNNIRFKYFFDGIQWIDGAHGEDYSLLAEKIFLSLKEKEPAPASKPEPVPASKPEPEPKPTPQPSPAQKVENVSMPPLDEDKPVLSPDGKTVTYGLYPQTIVSHPGLINELNGLTTPDKNGWYLHKGQYYAKTQATPHDMFKFSDGTAIAIGPTYWFKCEPIKWMVLQKGNGEVLAVSELLLDTHRFDASANDYSNSELRSWLNGEFLSAAFFRGSGKILMTDVDNSASGTGSPENQFACPNTSDKLFLLSYAESIDSKYGFTGPMNKDPLKIVKPTDYALAKGADLYKGAGTWWLRSPDDRYFNLVQYVGVSGTPLGLLEYVHKAGLCIRPALRIKL